MSFFKRLILTSCLLAFQFKASPSFKPTLNILTTMHVLNPDIVAKFEKENNANVRVDFVGSRKEFETHIRGGLRTYDVIVADERILEKLSLERMLKNLSDDVTTKNTNKVLLYKRSKINEDGRAYLPLYIDPMGIAYLKNESHIPEKVTWDLLIQTELNPYWRQRIAVSQDEKIQFLIALLATQKEISPNSWYIPESTTHWFKELRLQNANTDLPIEMAFLGKKISAAVLFYSDYLRLKRIVPNLNFMIPEQNTYYDRMSIGWSSSSVQEALAKKLILFLFQHRKETAHSAGLLPMETRSFLNSPTKNWILYEDDVPLPKKIENILKELTLSSHMPSEN
jgi:spermidine/putrescine-binding protein